MPSHLFPVAFNNSTVLRAESCSRFVRMLYVSYQLPESSTNPPDARAGEEVEEVDSEALLLYWGWQYGDYLRYS